MKSTKSLVFALATIFAATSAHAITIAQAKALGSGGATAALTGVTVSSVTDLISSSSSKNFMVQDATGGITVFGSNANIDALLASISVGSVIDLTGNTTAFNGLFELAAPFTLGTVTPDAAPAPINTTINDFQDGSATAEGLESKLVKLNNVTFDAAGGNFAVGNFTVSGSGKQALVRVSTSALNLNGTVIPGGPVNVTGILSQFDATDSGKGYQLLVRSVSDIESVPEPMTMAVLGLGVAALARRKRSR